MLIDAIRQLGADPKRITPGSPAVKTDPKLKELTEEIVRLSVEFGILTEYTAFLAKDGTDLSKRDKVLSEAQSNFVNRGMKTRSGIGAVNQGMNSNAQRKQSNLNRSNKFYDKNMNRVEIKNVQQVNDRAFFKRGKRWVDSQILEKEKEVKPDITIKFASDEYNKLVTLLTKQNRQGTISLKGDILLKVDGKVILIKAPKTEKETEQNKEKKQQQVNPQNAPKQNRR